MKRAIGIFFTILPALLILGLPVIPHHHHGGTACMVTDVCETADDGCECRDRHCGCGEAEADAGAGCIGESEFPVKISREEAEGALTYNILEFKYFLAGYAPLLPEEVSLPKESRAYGPPIAACRSEVFVRTGILRGPPSLLS